MTTTMKTLYPTLSAGNAIFTDLQDYDVPWKMDNINTILDYYYLSNSGGKHPAPLLLDMSYDDDTRTYENRTRH